MKMSHSLRLQLRRQVPPTHEPGAQVQEWHDPYRATNRWQLQLIATSTVRPRQFRALTVRSMRDPEMMAWRVERAQEAYETRLREKALAARTVQVDSAGKIVGTNCPFKTAGKKRVQPTAVNGVNRLDRMVSPDRVQAGSEVDHLTTYLEMMNEYHRLLEQLRQERVIQLPRGEVLSQRTIRHLRDLARVGQLSDLLDELIPPDPP